MISDVSVKMAPDGIASTISTVVQQHKTLVQQTRILTKNRKFIIVSISIFCLNKKKCYVPQIFNKSMKSPFNRHSQNGRQLNLKFTSLVIETVEAIFLFFDAFPEGVSICVPEVHGIYQKA